MKLLLSSIEQTVTHYSIRKPSKVKIVCTESIEKAVRFALKTFHSRVEIFRSLNAVHEVAESFGELTETIDYY